MAKGKATFQVGKAAGGGRRDYVYAVNKKNLPTGEKLKLMKYDKVSRTHIEYTFVDVK
jgi:ribosomal protein L33